MAKKVSRPRVKASPERHRGITSRRGMAEQSISALGVIYQRTQNPVFVWEAIGEAVDGGLPLPAFAAEYLARVAKGIRAMSRADVPKRNQIARSVYKTLEFRPRRDSGAVNPFRTTTDSLHGFAIAAEVFAEYRECGKLDFAFDNAARRHPDRCDGRERCRSISRSQVARHWRTWRSYFDRFMNATTS